MINTAKIDQALPVISAHIYGQQVSLTSDDILKIVQQFSSIYGLEEDDVFHLLRVLETRYVTTMGIGFSLIDEDQPHDEDWYKKDKIDWSYWSDYEQILVNQGWPTRVVHSIDNVTDKILGLLKDPQEDGDWERRGLVIGHVQSGKTANYTGLLTKAADAGYKFIIVIAGIHNNLRTQTQERIDRGFIGRDSETKQHIGVGLIRPDRDMPVTVTTTESDFNKTVAKRFGLELKSLNNTFILVIKKNVYTLSNLYNWLKELNTREELEKIADIPMLMIDDEADNASINTNKPELDPTRTNREIRNILNLFRKRCYVGYTATPFANIFINPDNYDDGLGSDIFPEHFIHCLDAPTNYFGTERIFLDDESNERFIRIIDDAEDFLPLKHKKDDTVFALPPSLKKAIRIFILSRTIRNIRGQSQSHSSMMINVSRFVAIQREISQLTEIYVEEIKNAVRYNYKKPVNMSLQDHHMLNLYRTFVEEFEDDDLVWEDLLEEIHNATSVVRVFVVNSKSDEKLDYSAYSKEGKPLTAIAIGGLSLSRGLTIEGLTVSYIYRNSKMYDTLMQMGRWFGYRDNYEDLCRIYMSEPSYGWYSHIAEATEELRMQIKQMRRERKKPIDFGLYVRAHPDTLIVTAMNKMRYAEGMELNVTYNGAQKDTYLVPSDERKIIRNQELLIEFFDHLSETRIPFRERNNRGEEIGSWLFTDIDWETVQDFAYRFNYHDYWLEQHRGIREYIQEIADLCPKWDVTFQSLSTKEPADGFMISTQNRTIGHDEYGRPTKPPSETEDGWYIGKKSRFSGNSMFKIGLDDDQILDAKNNAVENGRKNPIHKDYTNVRKKPVLLLHLLNLQHKVDEKNEAEIVLANVPGLSFSFLDFAEARMVKYVVGPVWLKQIQLDQFDSADEEDDYEHDPQ